MLWSIYLIHSCSIVNRGSGAGEFRVVDVTKLVQHQAAAIDGSWGSCNYHLHTHAVPTKYTRFSLDLSVCICLRKHLKAIAPPHHPPVTRNGQPHARRCHGQVSAPRDEVRRRHARLTLSCSGTGYSKLGFAGNDSPSFVFPTAIATKGPAGGAGGSGSGRPAVANKPTFLTGGAGGGHLSGKRGTEDLDFFIGDEALAAASGPGRQHTGRDMSC